MEEQFNKDKILARVKKMMTLANDAAASEGERDNALRMAHATLAKYNLSMAEAEKAGTKPEEKRTGDELVGQDYSWMRTVAHAAATLFFCNYFFVRMGRGKVQHYFVGKESNVLTAKAMTEYLISSINRQARPFGVLGGTYWRSFCKGASHAVYERCYEIQMAAEKAPKQPGTSLVLASVYASEQEANAEFIKVKMGIGNLKEGKNRERNTVAGAYHAGQDYGNSVSLNNQIGGRSPNRNQLK